MAKNKNINLLGDFVDYCVRHPDQRFWQALRNWAGFRFIYATNELLHSSVPAVDTFYFEGKDR